MASSITPTPTIISSAPQLAAFLSSIPTSSTLYLDLKGKRLSRNGTIAIITILVHPGSTVRIIDVSALGKSTFTTPSSGDGKMTLKSILEDPGVPKCLWDVRNDADALWALYGVGLAGVIDVQLLENASRSGDRTYLSGLDKAVQCDLKLGFMELNRWVRTKKEVTSRMPADIFSVRPIAAQTAQYCANDVVHLPSLRSAYLKRIRDGWLAKAEAESVRRVKEAHSPGYDPQSPDKKYGPWKGKPVMSLDDMLDLWAEQREGSLAKEIFGYDELEMDDFYDDFDDSGMNAADGAMDAEAFDSCWDKS